MMTVHIERLRPGDDLRRSLEPACGLSTPRSLVLGQAGQCVCQRVLQLDHEAVEFFGAAPWTGALDATATVCQRRGTDQATGRRKAVSERGQGGRIAKVRRAAPRRPVMRRSAGNTSISASRRAAISLTGTSGSSGAP